MDQVAPESTKMRDPSATWKVHPRSLCGNSSCWGQRSQIKESLFGCQAQKIWKISLWRRNLGEWPTWVKQRGAVNPPASYLSVVWAGCWRQAKRSTILCPGTSISTFEASSKWSLWNHPVFGCCQILLFLSVRWRPSRHSLLFPSIKRLTHNRLQIPLRGVRAI